MPVRLDMTREMEVAVLRGDEKSTSDLVIGSVCSFSFIGNASRSPLQAMENG